MTSSRPIVIVLGMHRSGTSLCAHMLSVLGMDMADEIEANEGNAQGHWERLEIVAFHDRILSLFDRDWFGPTHAYSLPRGWWADPRVRTIRNEIVSWLRDRIGTSRLFGFKDPRTTRLLPLWREVCGELGVEARFVLCVRHPALVARSLEARGDVADLRESEYRWVVYNARAVVDLDAQPVCVLPYEDWFDGGIVNLRRLAEVADAERGISDAVLRRVTADIVAPELRHHVSPLGERNDALSTKLHRLLIASVDQAGLSPELRDLAAEYCGFERLVEPTQQLASMVGPLQAALAECDARSAAAAGREADLLASITAQSQRADAATASGEALRAELVAASAREADLRAALAGEARRVETAVAVARDEERRASGLANDLREARAELARMAVVVSEQNRLLASSQDAERALSKELARQEEARLAMQADVARLGDLKAAAETDHARQSALVDRLLKPDARRRPIPFAVDRLVLKARRFARRREWAVAERLYRKVLLADPRLLPVWVQYGHMLKNQNDLLAAAGAYLRAATLDPTDVDALVHLGHVQKRLGRTEDAVATLRRAVRLQPGRTDVREDLRQLGLASESIRSLGRPETSVR